MKISIPTDPTAAPSCVEPADTAGFGTARVTTA